MSDSVGFRGKDAPTAFDAETISILSGALDDAWQVIETNKAPFRVDGDPEGARDWVLEPVALILRVRLTGGDTLLPMHERGVDDREEK